MKDKLDKKPPKEVKSTTSQGTRCKMGQEFDEEDERLLKHAKVHRGSIQAKRSEANN
jgi:hypothetical protein